MENEQRQDMIKSSIHRRLELAKEWAATAIHESDIGLNRCDPALVSIAFSLSVIAEQMVNNAKK